jgi:glycosyltransferase involved in cell wall biosynthesis
MAKDLPVVAAIPNFNMADSLGRLIPQVLAQGYDRVFVLDDASTDHTVDVVSDFGDDVHLVRNPENRGAGANRNQIIDRVEDGAIIHFIDADMDLETAEIPTVARELFERYADRGVGLIGGLVSRVDGSQEPLNYGAVFSLWSALSGAYVIVDRFRERPRLASAMQRIVSPIAKDWPNILETPTAAPAYWVHEGNMLVYSSIFRSLGGYDPMIRSHEAQDLAIRLEKMGVKRQFDPSIRVIHHHIDVRGKNRSKWENKAAIYLIRKHGLFRFLTER